MEKSLLSSRLNATLSQMSLLFADSARQSLHGELAPVLMRAGTELCHDQLDVAKVRAFLSEIR